MKTIGNDFVETIWDFERMVDGEDCVILCYQGLHNITIEGIELYDLDERIEELKEKGIMVVEFTYIDYEVESCINAIAYQA